MRLTIKVHDESKGMDGWTHMFITFNGIAKLEEIEEAEIQVTMDAQRNIKMQQDVHFARQLKPLVIHKDEGKVQTVKYERTSTVTKLEPIQINSNLFGNDNSSVFSANDSSSIGGRSVHSGQFRQIRVNGQNTRRYYQKNHPYKYYRNPARGEGKFMKKQYLTQNEIQENDPVFYRRILDAAAKEGYHEQPLEQEVYERIADDVCQRKPTIILTTGDYTNVTTAGSVSSGNPRSPLHGMDENEEQPWVPKFG